MNRRHFVSSLVTVFAVAGCGLGLPGEAGASPRLGSLEVTDKEWRELLTSSEYNVLREQGTERAFSGDLWDHKGDGVYVCAGCGLALYDSRTKFKSGTGWPSFYEEVGKDSIARISDVKFGMVRTETVCGRCGGHLGHVFTDGPKPTGLRHCINSASLDFVPRKEAKKLGKKPVLLGGWSPTPS